MPARAPPLPTTAFRLIAGLPIARPARRRRALARSWLGRLLRRRPERQPRQHGHLLGERADLAFQLSDPGLQHNVIRRQALRLGTPELDTARITEITTAHDAKTRSPSTARVQHPGPGGVSPQKSDALPGYGITECLRPMFVQSTRRPGGPCSTEVRVRCL
ncbi:MAG: hypothetical protein ACRDQ4_15115 [Pseudonocardiaceae bacterium]